MPCPVEDESRRTRSRRRCQGIAAASTGYPVNRMVVRDDVVAHRCADDRVVFDQRILMSASSCLFATLSQNCQPAEDRPCGSANRPG